MDLSVTCSYGPKLLDKLCCKRIRLSSQAGQNDPKPRSYSSMHTLHCFMACATIMCVASDKAEATRASSSSVGSAKLRFDDADKMKLKFCCRLVVFIIRLPMMDNEDTVCIVFPTVVAISPSTVLAANLVIMLLL